MQYEADLPHESERPPVEAPADSDDIDTGVEQVTDTSVESSGDIQDMQEADEQSAEKEAHLETVQRTMGQLALRVK